ncbi:hypothetical protein GcC1_132024 [Golovinomyces cichoracearum]|uniref:Uncharacterized protein n=1 Tax=Golovinomyces cichoracearum TaxID=62708 RepID=A0A420I3V8_9PEZI|nr:hypothetical protein GcC1_132024 [Golovinomyces cichoracearum]
MEFHFITQHARELTHGNLAKWASYSSNTRATQKSVWEIMNSTAETRHVLTVPCDSHDLQLIFKDLLWPDKDNHGNSTSAMGEFFKSGPNAVVSFFSSSDKQLALLRSVMQLCYSKIRALIKTTPTRWGKQIAQIDFICNSENALKGYIAHPDATISTIKSLLSTPQFWQKLSGLQLFFKPVHTYQKTSESNGTTLNKVYPRWIDINRHINEFQLEESCSPLWQKINSYCTSTQGGWNQRMEKQLLPIHLAAYILIPENSKTVILPHFQEQIHDFIRAKCGKNSSAVASNFEYIDQEGPFNILASC